VIPQQPAAERAGIVPAMTPAPGPAPAERSGVLTIEKPDGLEGEYTDQLFFSNYVSKHW
jgi:hypothetical protein